MPEKVLTTTSQVFCQHLAKAVLKTSNERLKVTGAAALLETDVHDVIGCQFRLPNGDSSPCVRIEWTAGASQMRSGGTKVLTRASTGKCISDKNVMQGMAQIFSTQTKTSAT